MSERSAGILLPITAIPSPYGVGSFGADARHFVDFLKDAGQKIWQVLPLVPTGYGDSPYSSSCATAGSPYLIDIDTLIADGLLTSEEAEEYSCESEDGRVDYEALFYRRIPILKLAFKRFDTESKSFLSFISKGEYTDFSVFMALKEAHGWRALSTWENKYRIREKAAISDFCNAHKDDILFWQFTQFVFFKQWNALKDYANRRGIRIMGDMPLYVSDDSSEMWAHPELFQLDSDGFPKDVAGVPPDYFSETGQLWGNPLYNWDKMKEDGYGWWTGRLKKALSMYDIVRIDHFRGFDRYYAVPAGSSDARVGEWRDGPKEALFSDKKNWHIVAEDLGTLDDGVYQLMKSTGYPGMKILEFGFDGNPDHPYKPSMCEENSVVYTGTHDNATFIEFISDMTNDRRHSFYRELSSECERWNVEFAPKNEDEELPETMKQALLAAIRISYLCKSRYVIIPLQDMIGTAGGTRMNTPGTLGRHNWSWRYCPDTLTDEIAIRFSKLAKESGR
ncbi:MAG: 4-alpha-glucanotransferase [Clostridia bacterium]|nr:4-alpha-glucanotransferase [Clostridia bacterium]